MSRGSPIGGDMAFDDLLHGMNEWRSIQEVIRNTFKALHDVIKAQGEAVKSLERQLEAKASKADLQSGLSRKANITDVNWSLAEVTRMVDGKAAIEDLERKADWKSVEVALESKASHTEVQAVQITAKEFASHKDIIEVQLHALSEQIGMKMDHKACRIALEAKASTHDIAMLQQAKVSRDELEQLLAAQARNEERNTEELRQQISRVASTCVSNTDMDAALEELAGQVSQAAEGARQATIKAEALCKRRNTQLEEKLEAIERETAAKIAQLERELTARQQHADSRHAERCEALQSELEDQISRVQKNSATERGGLRDGIEEVREDMDRLLNQAMTQIEAFMKQAARRDDVVAALAKKSDVSVVEDARQDIARLEEEVAKLQDGNDEVNRSTDNLVHVFESRADTQQSAMRATASAVEEVTEQLSTLSKTVTALSASAHRAEATRQLHDTRLHTVETQLSRHISVIQGTIDKVQRDLVVKATVSDMNIVLDTKANVDDVNRSLQQVNTALELRATQEELSTVVQEQALINSAVYSELCIGRWIWQSGVTKANNSVPWNVQTVNTDPENLLWERDKVNIVVRDPGLYEISFGFFSRKKPVVQILINGEPAFLVSNQHSLGGAARLIGSGRHSAGNVIGLTHIDFLALPAKARISLTYACETRAEGFLGLRKL